MSRSSIATLAAALLFALFVFWWLQKFELREVNQRAELRGEARLNPLFGLQQLLRARGLQVKSQAQLRTDALPSTQAALLILHADLDWLSSAASRDLLRWVEAGGDLVVGLPDGEDSRPPPLLRELGLHLHEHFSCVDWKYQPPPAAMKAAKRRAGAASEELPGLAELFDPLAAMSGGESFCSTHRLHFDRRELADDFDWLWGNDDAGYLFGRLRHGSGRVIFSAQLDFLSTRKLRTPANSALAWQLLGPSLAEGTEVLLVYATDLPPLHVLLVRHGWPILLPLLLALLAWLAARNKRFGPVLPAPQASRRALGEHLRAAAELALRNHQGSQLLQPLRRRLLRRLLLTEPEIAALPASELTAELAKRYRLSPQAVDKALFATQIRRPSALAEAVRTLHRLSQNP